MIILVSGCLETKPEMNNTSNISEKPRVVDTAISDLALRLNVQAEQIRILNVEKVNWPDASLGYPEKGMMYAQVITPGYRIILDAGGRTYEYHSDMVRVVGPKE